MILSNILLELILLLSVQNSGKKIFLINQKDLKLKKIIKTIGLNFLKSKILWLKCEIFYVDHLKFALKLWLKTKYTTYASF